MRMILGEPRPGAEGLLPHGAAETLRERDERLPGVAVVRPCADDEGWRPSLLDQRRQLGHGPFAGTAGAYDAHRGCVFVIVVGCGRPVVHRRDHDRGPAAGDRLVACAGHGTGHVLWPDRLVDPDRVITRETLQPAREERLERQVAAVLLPDEHDERRAVHPRGRERADGVAEPGSRMEDRERRLVAPDRPSGRHADDRALVQRKHEA